MKDDTERQLVIGGMHCAACAARVERAINAVPGVSGQVSFALETARITLSPGAAGIEAVIQAIERAGYSAKLAAEDAARQARADRARDMTALARLFWLSAFFTAPLVAQMLIGGHELIPRALQWLLATPVQFIAGARFYRGAWHAIKGGGANMDVLIALGTTMAWGLSTAVWLTGQHTQHVYFEASAAIITLVLMGKWLEARAKSRTTDAIEALAALAPATALVERDGKMIEVPLAEITRGMVFFVPAGSSVPVDGEVLSGASSIDESMLTGESLPRPKGPGDKVFAGTLNAQGLLKCRATGVGQGTLLAGILRMVESAQASRAPVQRLADRVSAVFVPVVCVIALATFAVGGAFTGDWQHALINAVAVLVIACPCALGLATPTAIIVGTGRGAQNGILIKNAESLELARNIQVLAIDKTGTLTEGRPSLTDIIPLQDITDAEALTIAASLEQGSTHPLASAMLDAAQHRALALRPLDALTTRPGEGLIGEVGGQAYTLGAPQPEALPAGLLEPLYAQGKTLMVLSSSAAPLALFACKDTLREGAPAAIARLKSAGIKVVMLTGDNPATAAAIAREAGIDEFRAGLLPEDKSRAIAAMKQPGAVVAMAGDGINDAPALAAADVSFALGTGSDAALGAADITLAQPDLARVADAIALSRATFTKIRQNLFFAFFYNVLGIPLAMFGWLNPVVAGAAMALSSVSVVSNSLMLRRWQPGGYQRR